MNFVGVLLACDGFEYGFSDPDEVVPDPVWVEERLSQTAAPAVDVLFVVDGTGSMGDELAAISTRAGTFIESLDGLGLAWQVGVTTTDPDDGGELQGRPWIITPATPAPAEALSLILELGATHAPPSAGLDAAAVAIATDTEANIGFRRNDAALHVLFLSDDDDQSGAVLGVDPVAGFLSILASESARTGFPARASAIVGDVPSGCDGGTGTAGPGTRYVAVATASGGTVTSVCNVDFSAAALALAETAVDWPSEFALQAVPVEGSVTVVIDDVRNEAFTVKRDVPSIVFAVPPPAGAIIRVRYEVQP